MIKMIIMIVLLKNDKSQLLTIIAQEFHQNFNISSEFLHLNKHKFREHQLSTTFLFSNNKKTL